MNKKVHDQLLRARVALYLDEPFYGILAMRLEMKEDASIPTLCVSHTAIYYNPKFVETLNPSLTKSALAHEVLHPMMDHIDRRGNREPLRWNQATDFVVNAYLKESRFEIGPSWLYDPKYDGMSAEHIYELLPESQDQGQGQGQISIGTPLDTMNESASADEKTSNALDWQLAATAAAKIAQQKGKLPANLKRLIEQLTEPQVHWRESLKRFFTERARDDYSWRHIQRRMVPFGFVLPGLYSERMGNIAVVIDTSGSIDHYTLQRFGAEIKSIRDAVNPKEITVIYCDAAIAHVDKFEEHDPLIFDMHGGGGTDFRPPFKHIEDNNERPACLVYLTDGYGSFPDDAPSYPVMWAMTTDVNPPWGETLRIDT